MRRSIHRTSYLTLRSWTKAVTEVATSYYERFRSGLTNRQNPIILTLNLVNIPGNLPRRLNS